MARSGYWNKRKVSEAKHYPTGIRRYCDKHNVSYMSYQNYCFRHNISSESEVVDRKGNTKWTFDLFQQALKAPSASKFCKENNLSYTTFNNYKKFGFPGQKVKKKELKQLANPEHKNTDELITNTASDFTELTEDDMAYIFNDVQAVNELAVPMKVSNDPVETDNVVEEDKPAKKHKKKGFWTLELIKTAKNYEGGIEKFCEDYGVTLKAYQMACDRFGVSSSVKTMERNSRRNHRTRANYGRKERFWSIEKIAEAKSYPGGIKKFCQDNDTTVKAYQMACYVRGVDYHADAPTESTIPETVTNITEKFQCNGKRAKGFWSLERIEEANSFEGGVMGFCKHYNLSLQSYRRACTRYGVPNGSRGCLNLNSHSKIDETPVETIDKIEPVDTTTKSVADLKPYLSINVFDKIRCSVIIKFKDGKVKELKAPEVGKTCFVLPSDMEIETLEFTGKGTISFI